MRKISNKLLILLLLFVVGLIPARAENSSERVETGWFLEDFENGTPEGWDIGMYYMSSGGVNDSRAMHCESYYDEVGNSLVTHFTRMGDNPYVSFEYKVYGLQFGSFDSTAAESDDVRFRVDVSDDEGATWTTVYRIQPEDGDMCHQKNSDFTRITIPLPQYSGKTCRIKIVLDYFISAEMKYCRYVFDNIEAGTQSDIDLGVSALSGPLFVTAGHAVEYTVTVDNKGSDMVSGETIELRDGDGNVIATTTFPEVSPSESVKVILTWTPDREGVTGISATVNTRRDADPSNNTTPVSYVRVYDNGPASIAVGKVEGKPSPTAPVNFYTRNSYIQTIYNANEIGYPGMSITGLRYGCVFKLPLQTCPITVWIGETDKENFSNSTDWIDLDNLTKVFEGCTYIDDVRQEMEIAFQTPYEYKGKHLVVCMSYNDNDFYDGLNFKQDNNERFANATLAAANDITEPQEKPDGEITYPVSPEHPGEGITYALIPVVDLIGTKYPTGNVRGIVKDDKGNPLSNAVVKVKGTPISIHAESDGRYEIPLLAGNYTLAYQCHGYFDHTEEIEISEGSNLSVDVRLTQLNSYVAKGKVSDMSGTPVAGLTVNALGYRNYKTTTGEDGSYSISGIASADGSDYTIRVSGAGYEPIGHKVDLSDNTPIDFTIKEQLVRPYRVDASVKESAVHVKWENPVKEYSYDAPGAQVNNYAAFIGWINSVIGTAFPYKTMLREVMWFTTDLSGTSHPSVNIVITELDEIGWPTRHVIKVINNVPNTDNQWSRYEFDEPLECPYGFFVGLNYPYGNGNIDICFTEPDEEHPVVERRYFGCDDINFESDKRGRFADMAPHYNGNMLVRAVGDDLGDVDYTDYNKNYAPRKSATGHPDVPTVACTFDVYRFAEGQTEDCWTLIQQDVTGNELTDTSVMGLGKGKYGYAVAARYPSGVSTYRVSGLVDITGSGLSNVDTEIPQPVGIYRINGTKVQGKPEPGVYVIMYSDGSARKTTIK